MFAMFLVLLSFVLLMEKHINILNLLICILKQLNYTVKTQCTRQIVQLLTLDLRSMAMEYRMHQGLLKLIPNIRRHALQSKTFVGLVLLKFCESGKSATIYAYVKEQDFHVIEARPASVTFFAGITSSVFFSLPKEKQDFILTSSVNAALNNEVFSIRSTTCRAIGVITCFSQIAQSVEILGKFIHAADINTRDPLVLVIFLVSSVLRITASWALANICDSLYHCINVVTSKRCSVDLKVASHLIVLLIECSLRLPKDGDKGVDMFDNRVGFVKFNVDMVDKATGKKVPGIVFARGPVVVVLILLELDGKTYAVLTKQQEKQHDPESESHGQCNISIEVWLD
ncbi:hypothetical protein LOK49_LG10G00188 [Camellia lanceoleosa]|uniref:Uncharacterized protein n=1 Tax=Camellia lanceoleosa TaxID=1840588 RepID=A0ACC0G909_9ERIC|nr:hypothetical protein LOK49_LG10G00188 [Camellia lanceoleosa]